MNFTSDNFNKKYPLLYNYRRCPYAMRARMCLVASGVSFTQIDIDLKNKPPEMLVYSPKATVPILVIRDDIVIDQSLDIMKWALSQQDPYGWLEISISQTDELIEMNDIWFKKSLDIYKYSNRHSLEATQQATENVVKFYHILELLLAKNTFLISNNPSFVDVAIFPFIRQSVAVDKEWFMSHNLVMLQKWLDYFMSLDLFKKIMQKTH